MKSIEEKAKAYDDLLTKLQKAKVDNDVCDERYCCVIDDIVPELVESEDERIRKELIDYFNSFHLQTFAGIDPKKILSWLEKQGGQKPVDKIEAKFKVGDWITNNIDTNKIIGIDIENESYLYENGSISDISLADNISHLWTIQDAKDGDVLADTLPFIFKKIDSSNYSYAYCGICADLGFKIESEGELGEWTWSQYIKPATKEQRDLLFAKMKDAGYTFDFEKKELKKIEQKPTWSEEDERIIKGLIGSFTRISLNTRTDSTSPNYTFYREIDWLKSLRDRYTWKLSDEQIKMLKNVRKILHTNKDIYSKANNLMYNFEEFIRTLEKLKGESYES